MNNPIKVKKKKEEKKQMAKVALYGCLDSLTDVPCLVLCQAVESMGHEIKPVRFAGGSIEDMNHHTRQFTTLSSLGFKIGILSVHTRCHHGRVHGICPQGMKENDFLEVALLTMKKGLEKKFPSMKFYTFRIDTHKSLSGFGAIVPITKKDKDFLTKSLKSWEKQLA